ncbi:MAG: 2'-5' RNA ligase family protein [Sphingomicrobium sp.]
MAGALIVTVEIADRDFSWIDALRRAHYPAERNQVPAHLTLFHALPPSSENEVRRRLALAVRAPPPSATIAGLMDLGGGVAFRVVSPQLDRLREELASDLHGLLGAQDSSGWRPHVTIQNKVAPKTARVLIASLQGEFEPRALGVSGLALNRYLGGSWEPIARFPFRGVS